jgi:hypothetical protein
MRAVDGAPGAEAPAFPGKTALLSGKGQKNTWKYFSGF